MSPLRRKSTSAVWSPALSESTRRAYGGDIDEFCGWLEGQGTSLDAVDVRTLADYVAWTAVVSGR